jgi:hypothetical protein
MGIILGNWRADGVDDGSVDRIGSGWCRRDSYNWWKARLLLWWEVGEAHLIRRSPYYCRRDLSTQVHFNQPTVFHHWNAIPKASCALPRSRQ